MKDSEVLKEVKIHIHNWDNEYICHAIEYVCTKEGLVSKTKIL